jgi:hypothetical protein
MLELVGQPVDRRCQRLAPCLIARHCPPASGAGADRFGRHAETLALARDAGTEP